MVQHNLNLSLSVVNQIPINHIKKTVEFLSKIGCLESGIDLDFLCKLIDSNLNDVRTINHNSNDYSINASDYNSISTLSDDLNDFNSDINPSNIVVPKFGSIGCNERYFFENDKSYLDMPDSKGNTINWFEEFK